MAVSKKTHKTVTVKDNKEYFVRKGKVAKIPKPKIKDRVEMIDYTKGCGGIVIKIVSNSKIEINWGNHCSIEKIKNVALVNRF